MTPLGFDPSTGRWRYAVLLGVRALELIVSWAAPPIVRPLDGGPLSGQALDLRFTETRYTLLTPLAVELSVAAPLDRVSLRALGDTHRSAQRLIRALERGEVP